MARSELVLASEIHKSRISSQGNPGAMRADIISKIHTLRKRRQHGVVVQFKEQDYDAGIMDFVKIGQG